MEKTVPIIEFKGADIENGGNLILTDVNISINMGDFVYLVGKVGSGKTSLIKTLIAELPVKKGEVRIGEYHIDKLKKKHIPYLRRSVGVVFQDFQLLMDRSVYDNLLFVLKSTGWSNSKEMKNVINNVLKDVGMQTKAHKMPHQLSGGEQQRIAIARALLNKPDIILADEPTGNLDADTTTEIMELFREIHRSLNPTIIMVTHNQSIYQKYQGRVFLCENQGCREISINSDFSLYE